MRNQPGVVALRKEVESLDYFVDFIDTNPAKDQVHFS